MDISVIVPLYNEAESLSELHAWIKRVMDEHGYSYEIYFVNDGSTDDSWQVIEGLHAKYPEVKGIKFRRNYGKSPALFCGFDRAEGDVVITMGCNVQCPFLPCSHREDWGLEDPSGKPDEAFLKTIRLIEEKILDLKTRI